MFATLALGSAVIYGAADFFGGLASRRASTIAVVILSQFAGLVLVGIMLPLLPDAFPGRPDVLWGAAAGLTGGAGVALLYRALAIGTMAIVAPVTAVCGVILPVLVSFALGERPAPLALTGMGVALVAIVLVSQPAPQPDAGVARRTSGLWLAIASGAAIGLFYLSLARTGAHAGLWPLAAARVASVSLFSAIALVNRTSLGLPAGAGAIAIAGGVLDMLANLLYLIATRSGPLSIAVTLTSLYPASTVLLARVLLKERLSATQAMGVVFALVAVVLIVGAGAGSGRR